MNTKIDGTLNKKSLSCPCYKYIVRNINSIGSLPEYAKNFMVSVVKLGYEYNEAAMFLQLSMCNITPDSPIAHADIMACSGKTMTAEELYRFLTTSDSISCSRSCYEYYGKFASKKDNIIDRNRNLCKTCPHSHKYTNQFIQWEYSVIKYALQSEKNAIYIKQLFKDLSFISVLDLATELAINKPFIVPISQKLYRAVMLTWEKIGTEPYLKSNQLFEILLEQELRSLKNVPPSMQSLRWIPQVCGIIIDEVMASSDLKKEDIRRTFNTYKNYVEQNQNIKRTSKKKETKESTTGIDILSLYLSQQEKKEEKLPAEHNKDNNTDNNNERKGIKPSDTPVIEALDSNATESTEKTTKLLEDSANKITITEIEKDVEENLEEPAAPQKIPEELPQEGTTLAKYIDLGLHTEEINNHYLPYTYTENLTNYNYIEPGFLTEEEEKLCIPLTENLVLLSVLENLVLSDKKIYLEAVRTENNDFQFVIWNRNKHIYYITQLKDETVEKKESNVEKVLFPLLTRKSIQKICYNAHALYATCRMKGATIRNVHSIHTAHYLIKEINKQAEYCDARSLICGYNTPVKYTDYFESHDIEQTQNYSVLAALPCYKGIYKIQEKEIPTVPEENRKINCLLEELIGYSYITTKYLKSNIPYLYHSTIPGKIRFNSLTECYAKEPLILCSYIIEPSQKNEKALMKAMLSLTENGKIRKMKFQILNLTEAALSIVVPIKYFDETNTILSNNIMLYIRKQHRHSAQLKVCFEKRQENQILYE